jgi:pyruvate kinase
MYRRTGILATLGPATDDLDTIRALIRAGTDAVRLNFSHGTHESHAELVRLVRRAAADVDRPVGILQDLSGPKLRIGRLEPSSFVLEEGTALVIEHGSGVGRPGHITSTAEAFFAAADRGERVLLDDGRIELEVVDVASGRVTTQVVGGGELSGGKGLSLPGVALPVSALTPKDLDDLRAGVAMGMDLVALSFVQGPDDITQARAALAAAGAPDVAIVAKIEKPLAVQRIDEIVAVADGIMVARGDLGIELPLERLPTVQKQIVQAARRRGVPVIVATQVLESMREEPRPTRAEVTDAAHAVDESVDAIMLAGETASGKYPERAVRTLDAIVREAERAAAEAGAFDALHQADPAQLSAAPHVVALCEAAVTLAARAGAHAIVAVTQAGQTARMLAALRPAARIIAGTPSAQTAARLALVWGVTPVIVPDPGLAAVRDAVVARGLASPGAVLVFVSVHSVLARENANFMHVERL